MARSEHVGVPIDMEISPDLADKKTWREMRDSMVPLVDVHGVYVRDKFGEWHFNIARFEEWTASEGINWPRKQFARCNVCLCAAGQRHGVRLCTGGHSG